VRFSNVNTTTDRYRWGARPGFAHTLLDLPAAVEDDDDEDDDDDGAGVVVVACARGVEREEDELHPAVNIPTRASIVAHRRNETMRRS
jgi:hypothetical protein